MSESCNQNCSGCAQDCEDRKDENSFKVNLSSKSSVKKVIGVVSGKGGVGKSLVTSMLSVAMRKKGDHVAILDADITGPSIPKAFGITGRAYAIDDNIIPAKSELGIDIMSVNLLVENVTDPVVWRGPIIAETVKQFWGEVLWEDVDYMFVDMPPGTGDVPLTVFQSLPLAGIVIVTSPQDLVTMIVEKAYNMANKMNVPILGIVENMSYFECSDCGKKHFIFGKSDVENLAKRLDIKAYAQVPMNEKFATACDGGKIESMEFPWLDSIVSAVENI